MGLIAPGTYVAPPALYPHRYGLYSVAAMPNPEPRWDLGIEWEPLTGQRAELRPSECVNEYTPDVEIRVGEETLEGVPFVVVGSYQCKAQSRPMAEAEERAMLHLMGGEERAVEYAIATGLMGNLPSFQGATDLTPTPGTPTDPITAVGLLEGAFASYANIGVLHAPHSAAALMKRWYLLQRHDEHVETFLGSDVVLGAGYDLANVGPDGSPAPNGAFWLYGTGRPQIRRSEVFIQPDETKWLDRDTNDVVILAQRTVLVTWDEPAALAVLVDRSPTID